MVVLYAFLILIEIVSAALLIGVIFLQKSSGAGMGTAFGGAGESIFGSRMGNVLTKATVVLAAIFLANTTLLAWVGARRQPTSVVERVPLHDGPGVPAGRPMAPTDDRFLADPEAFKGELHMDIPDGAVQVFPAETEPSAPPEGAMEDAGADEQSAPAE